ncbi:MAG: hypothetical protein AAGJ56_07975 [Myxococcota bacterium]
MTESPHYPPIGDPRDPLPGEVTPAARRRLVALVAAILVFALGAVVGVWLSPESSTEATERIAELEAQLKKTRAEAADLRRQLNYGSTAVEKSSGSLDPAIARRHLKQAKRITSALRQAKAQGASMLFDWFVDRWNRVLDHPREDDRVGRRAELLSRLVGGMSENLNPGDYVPWQTELYRGAWLAELHYDLDGDGLPGPRKSRNRNDGFADKSICHIAMALNQSITDAQVLVMDDLRCHEARNRMTAFLQGETFDDALDEFAEAARGAGFLVVERTEKRQRLILVGNRKRR